ncbi:hypothetical protein OV450_7777 [Actinobacteria bacterium OV450]|nr:hypothetical protein OV450_7777 [Actinobacteria bacterium OV450]
MSTPVKFSVFDDTPQRAHPQMEEIIALNFAWMCEKGLLPGAELRDRWQRMRASSWPCHFYPYADYDYMVLVARWWEWWIYLDMITPKFDFATWARLSMEMQRVFYRAGRLSPDPATPSPIRELLIAQGELCRCNAELSSPALYQLLADACTDSLNGFNIEIAYRESLVIRGSGVRVGVLGS